MASAGASKTLTRAWLHRNAGDLLEAVSESHIGSGGIAHARCSSSLRHHRRSPAVLPRSGRPGCARAGPPARISDQLLYVPALGSGAGRPLPRDRAGSSGLRALRCARRRGVRLHLRRSERVDSRLAAHTGNRSVRDVRAGLRCPDWVAAGACRPGRDHGDHQSKRQRLRRRVRGELLEGRVGLPN